MMGLQDIQDGFSSCTVLIANIDANSEHGTACSSLYNICCYTCFKLEANDKDENGKYIALMRTFTQRKMLIEVFNLAVVDFEMFLTNQK